MSEPLPDIVQRADIHYSGEGLADAVRTYAAAAVAAETERLTMLCDNLRECIKNCASSAYREGQVDERERIAAWIETQRNDVPATGAEFAAAIRAQK